MTRTLRIVSLSDTHSKHNRVQVPDGDILIHAGDATGRGNAAELIEFNRWLGTLPHPHKIVCAGNHDFIFEKNYSLACGLLTNATYAQDELLEVCGLRIYVSPWQPRFFDWAFNLNRGAEIRRKWDVIPSGLDVLVTHGPPFGILDVSGLSGEHVGCEELRAAVERVGPRVHIFGHIHHGYGVMDYNGTRFVNASTCNERYQPLNPPVVTELSVM